MLLFSQFNWLCLFVYCRISAQSLKNCFMRLLLALSTDDFILFTPFTAATVRFDLRYYYCGTPVNKAV